MDKNYATVMLTNNPTLLEVCLKHSERFDKHKLEFVFDNRLGLQNKEKIDEICKKYNITNYNVTNGDDILKWFNKESAVHDYMSLNVLVDIWFLKKYDKIIRIEDDMIIDFADRFYDLFETKYEIITTADFWGGKPPKYKEKHMDKFITDIDYKSIFEDNKNRINGGAYFLNKNVLNYYENLLNNWYEHFTEMYVVDKRGYRYNDEIILSIVREKFNGLNSKDLQRIYSNDKFKNVKTTKKIIRHYMGANSKRKLLELLEVEDEFNDVIR